MAGEAVSLEVIAKRGDTLMLADTAAGPGVLVYRDGEASAFHRDTAMARGYWEDATGPAPEVPERAIADLAAFNARWMKTQKVLDGQPDAARSEGSDDDLDEIERAMAPDGDELEAYWTRGKGLARWRLHPHPWRRLRGLLRKHPGIHDPEGLASHYFHVVFGYWPGERKGENAVGPG